MMMFKNKSCALLTKLLTVSAASLIAACASTSQVSSRYLDAEIPAAQQILLVARAAENNMRIEWERVCLAQLKATKINLTPSYIALANWSEGTNEALLDWAAEQTIASEILIFEISGLLIAPPQIPPNNEVSVKRYHPEEPIGEPTWTFSFGAKDQKQTPPERYFTEVRLLTAEGQTRWEGLITSHEANDLSAIARSQCKSMVSTLKELNTQ
jgi:hypothetical protein